MISDEGVDEAAFNLLTENFIADLVPRIGPRLKFLAKYREYKAVSMSNSAKNSVNIYFKT